LSAAVYRLADFFDRVFDLLDLWVNFSNQVMLDFREVFDAFYDVVQVPQCSFLFYRNAMHPDKARDPTAEADPGNHLSDGFGDAHAPGLGIGPAQSARSIVTTSVASPLPQ
jgi:hypothetical protein